MDDVLKFNKSLLQRLMEYNDILPTESCNSIALINKAWMNYIDMYMDPCGWQAIWKVPRLTCENLKIRFPTIILVYVEDIISEKLSAVVKVVAVLEEITLPDTHLVPLMQLWPTKGQDKTVALNLETTANTLDVFRFFYTNIFFPWDYDSDGSFNWLKKHLESRIRFYHDLKNGSIPVKIVEHINSLLSQARRIQAQREHIEEELSDSDSESGDDNKIETLKDLNVSLLQIKSEIKLLENPVTREVLVKRDRKLIPSNKLAQDQFWLISNEGSIDNYLDFLKKVKDIYPNRNFKISNDLKIVLETMEKDTIILNNAIYNINKSSGLELGGMLRGVDTDHKCILKSSNDNIMLDLCGETVLENLVLDASASRCGVIIRSGRTIFKNCKLIGNKSKSTQQGIIILDGAAMELINCSVNNFSTAIIGNSGSVITLKNTEIFNVGIGVKIFDQCVINAEQCSFHDCNEYGFCIETGDDNTKHTIGSFEVLQHIPGIKLKDIQGRQNNKGNVLIRRVAKVVPVNDLFSNPEIDPTRHHTIEEQFERDEDSEDDEEMDCQEANRTVIENDQLPLDAGDSPAVLS